MGNMQRNLSQVVIGEARKYSDGCVITQLRRADGGLGASGFVH